jgi:hypothetical protein
MSGVKKSTTTKTIKKILVSQARPESDKSPYFELERKYSVALHFQPLIQLVPISGKDFRKTKIDIAEYTAVIFTSKNAIDHFFRTCDELKINISQDTKYFCITESVALYLQKFIMYRKNLSGARTNTQNRPFYYVNNEIRDYQMRQANPFLRKHISSIMLLELLDQMLMGAEENTDVLDAWLMLFLALPPDYDASPKKKRVERKRMIRVYSRNNSGQLIVEWKTV